MKRFLNVFCFVCLENNTTREIEINEASREKRESERVYIFIKVTSLFSNEEKE